MRFGRVWVLREYRAGCLARFEVTFPLSVGERSIDDFNDIPFLMLMMV